MARKPRDICLGWLGVGANDAGEHGERGPRLEVSHGPVWGQRLTPSQARRLRDWLNRFIEWAERADGAGM